MVITRRQSKLVSQSTQEEEISSEESSQSSLEIESDVESEDKNDLTQKSSQPILDTSQEPELISTSSMCSASIGMAFISAFIFVGVAVFSNMVYNRYHPAKIEKCSFYNSYYTGEEFEKNFSMLVSEYSKKNISLASLYPIRRLISKYLNHVKKKDRQYPLVFTVIKSSKSDKSILREFIGTFSSNLTILSGHEYNQEKNMNILDSRIKKSLQQSKSTPVIISNAHKIHPNVARVLFKYCDGKESYCTDGLFIFIIQSESSENYWTDIKNCENESKDIYEKSWSENLPEYVLSPLINRLTEFTVCI